MRKTKIVQDKTPLLRAQRKVLQVVKYGFVMPVLMEQDEAKALLALIRLRKSDLITRRNELRKQVDTLGLGMTVTFDPPEDIDMAHVAGFVNVLEAVAGGEEYEYEVEWVRAYLDYMRVMDNQIETLFEMTRETREN